MIKDTDVRGVCFGSRFFEDGVFNKLLCVSQDVVTPLMCNNFTFLMRI